jgi:hypothetical protein
MLPNLVLLGLLALSVAAAMALFLSLKYEVRVQARRDRARLDQILNRLQDAERPAPEPAQGLPAPVALRAGMNINKRMQAVRLLRRGEDIGHVAAVLGVTRSEIELLMRVQKISAQRAAGAGG